MQESGSKFYANSLSVAAVTGTAAQRAARPSAPRRRGRRTGEPSVRTATGGADGRSDEGIYGARWGQIMGKPRCQRPGGTSLDRHFVIELSLQFPLVPKYHLKTTNIL